MICTVFELRQYTLRPGRRDELIDLFEREFVETQEAVGMRLVGTFRDLDRPDRFVWVRGFADMPARRSALSAFYGGPVWATHGAAANATMIDSDDVLLLRPISPPTGFPETGTARPEADPDSGEPAVVTAAVYPLPVNDDGFVADFEARIRPAVESALEAPIVTLHTEAAENTFPALPVREGENVLVWFAAGGSRDHARRLDRVAHPEPAQLLRLEPTARSAYR